MTDRHELALSGALASLLEPIMVCCHLFLFMSLYTLPHSTNTQASVSSAGRGLVAGEWGAAGGQAGEGWRAAAMEASWSEFGRVRASLDELEQVRASWSDFGRIGAS